MPIVSAHFVPYTYHLYRERSRPTRGQNAEKVDKQVGQYTAYKTVKERSQHINMSEVNYLQHVERRRPRVQESRKFGILKNTQRNKAVK